MEDEKKSGKKKSSEIRMFEKIDARIEQMEKVQRKKECGSI